MQWYVLQVKTSEEINVRDWLKKLGIIAHAPQEARPTRKGGDWEPKLYTIFNGYVFVQCEFDADTYYKVKSVPSVIKWLGTAPASPTPISYAEVEWIRELSNGDNPLEPSTVTVDSDGNNVVTGGVLKSFERSIKKIDRHAKKATIEITIANETKSIQLGIDILNGNSEKDTTIS